MMRKSATTLASLATMGALLLAAQMISATGLFGDRLERKYPDKFDYQGILDFYVNNNLVIVHFGHLNDFVDAISHLRDQYKRGEFSKFARERRYSEIFINTDNIIQFGQVVRGKDQLCNTKHIVELLDYNANILTKNEFMSKHFAHLFSQYIMELGRLCKAKVPKINGLFNGQNMGMTLTEEEHKNVGRVRDASMMLCNFVNDRPASELCSWDDNQLSEHNRMLISRLFDYRNRDALSDLKDLVEKYVEFYTSLSDAETDKRFRSLKIDTTVDESAWIDMKAKLDERKKEQSESKLNNDNHDHNHNQEGLLSFPVQPLHAACELLENVYEQSTQPTDLLGKYGAFTKNEYKKFLLDPVNKKWLFIEIICSEIMRTRLEFNEQHGLIYPFVGLNRTVKKSDRQLMPFASSKQEEQMHQIDFTRTYKSAYTFKTRFDVSLGVIGDTTFETLDKTTNILLAPLRLLGNSIFNLIPETADNIRAVKYGSAAQRDYYSRGELNGISQALGELKHAFHVHFDKSRFYNTQQVV